MATGRVCEWAYTWTCIVEPQQQGDARTEIKDGKFSEGLDEYSLLDHSFTNVLYPPLLKSMQGIMDARLKGASDVLNATFLETVSMPALVLQA